MANKHRINAAGIIHHNRLLISKHKNCFLSVYTYLLIQVSQVLEFELMQIDFHTEFLNMKKKLKDKKNNVIS